MIIQSDRDKGTLRHKITFAGNTKYRTKNRKPQHIYRKSFTSNLFCLSFYFDVQHIQKHPHKKPTPKIMTQH